MGSGFNVATETKATLIEAPAVKAGAGKTIFNILLAISFCHLLNDTIQSVLPAIYPMLKASFHLDFGQVGLIALTLQLTASLLQPLVGLHTDKHPQPYSLAVGMGITLIGLLALSMAPTYATVLVAAGTVGIGSAVFHPESSRVARMASGGQHGLAQSLFQVGGNAGSALGPLLAAFVLTKGQSSIAWFSFLALAGIMILTFIGTWAKNHRAARAMAKSAGAGSSHTEHLAALPSSKIAISMAILIALMFSKFFYLASITSYFTFYLMNKFQLSLQSAQLHLFIFLGAVAAGTIAVRNLGFHPWRASVHLVAALRESAMDHRFECANRNDSSFGFFRNFGLRAGAGPWKSRDDFRPVFWLRFRLGRRRGSVVRQIGGFNLANLCLPCMRIPSGHRHFDSVPA